MDSAAPLGRFVWHDLMTTDVAAATSFYTGLFPEWTITTLPMEGGFDYHMIGTAGGEVGGMLELDEALGKLAACWNWTKH
jgi:predicted enzyme related to lactoylglutathione lyase